MEMHDNEEQLQHYKHCIAMFERTRHAHEARTPDEWLLAWFEFNNCYKYYCTNHVRPMISELHLPEPTDWGRSATWAANSYDEIPVFDTDGNQVK